MLILGLLLVLASAAGAALLVAYNSSGGTEQSIVLFGRDLVSVTPAAAFVSGIVIALIFCLGVWMVVTTERRRLAVRSRYQAARREARAAAAERDELAEQLARERAAAEQQTTTTWKQPEPTERVVADETAPTTPARGLGRHFRRSRVDRAEAPADEAPVGQQTTTG